MIEVMKKLSPILKEARANKIACVVVIRNEDDSDGYTGSNIDDRQAQRVLIKAALDKGTGEELDAAALEKL